MEEEPTCMAAVASGTGNVGDVGFFGLELLGIGSCTCGQKCIVMALRWI